MDSGACAKWRICDAQVRLHLIERMVEPRPSEGLQNADPEGYEQLRRLPAFIFMRARKADSGSGREYRGSGFGREGCVTQLEGF
jgi:hypothetical protein